MHVPTWFSRQLAAEHDGRLRIRWSPRAHQFLIEQKNHPGRSPHRKIDPLDDRAIQWRDGYVFVLGVTPGDRAQCPSCGKDTHVPVMEMKFARCEHCRKEFRACHWPLGDALLQWLRWSDPYRDGIQRQAAVLDNFEFERDTRLRRDAFNKREAIGKEEFTNIFDIQSVGYTGRETMWVK